MKSQLFLNNLSNFEKNFDLIFENSTQVIAIGSHLVPVNIVVAFDVRIINENVVFGWNEYRYFLKIEWMKKSINKDG